MISVSKSPYLTPPTNKKERDRSLLAMT